MVIDVKRYYDAKTDTRYNLRYFVHFKDDCHYSDHFTAGRIYVARFKDGHETGEIYDNDGKYNYFDPRDKVYNSHWIELDLGNSLGGGVL